MPPPHFSVGSFILLLVLCIFFLFFFGGFVNSSPLANRMIWFVSLKQLV